MFGGVLRRLWRRRKSATRNGGQRLMARANRKLSGTNRLRPVGHGESGPGRSRALMAAGCPEKARLTSLAAMRFGGNLATGTYFMLGAKP
jgi:hypothetical protein